MENDAVEQAGKSGEPRSNARPDDTIDRQQLEQDVRTKLRVIFSSAKKQSREIEEQYNVSAAQLWMLVELQKQPGLRVSDVARILHVHNSTASNLIDSLEKRRLVRRERSDEDQRVVHLHLTAEGKRFVLDVPQPSRAVVTDALAAISLDALIALDQALEELVASLKIKDTAAALTPIADI